MSQAMYPDPATTLPQKEASPAVSLSAPQRGAGPDVESKKPSPCGSSGGHHATGFPASSFHVLNRSTQYVSTTSTADATSVRISASEGLFDLGEPGVDRGGGGVLGWAVVVWVNVSVCVTVLGSTTVVAAVAVVIAVTGGVLCGPPDPPVVDAQPTTSAKVVTMLPSAAG